MPLFEPGTNSAVRHALEKVADVAQIPVKYYSGSVVGQREFVLRLQGLQLTGTMQAKAVFIHESVGALFHVMGNLYILVAYFGKNDVISSYIIDREKIEAPSIAGLIEKSMSLKTVVTALRKGIVRSFVLKDQRWSEMTLPA